MHGEQMLGGLIALSLMKKATVYGVARYYGFPRLYRRIARLNRTMNMSPHRAREVNNMIKNTFRFPNRFLSLFRNAYDPDTLRR